jgi:hypothetical protein
MKFAKLALASAILAAFSAPALADPPANLADLSNTTSVTTDVTVAGGAAVVGVVPIAAEAGAVTDNTQASVGNLVITVGGGNTADVSNTANGVTGNVGINIASGSGNMQDNQLAAAVRTGTVGSGTLAKATGSNDQVVALTLNGDLDFNLTNNASITNALTGSGNIGANVAAGYGNLQHNSLSIAAAK